MDKVHHNISQTIYPAGYHFEYIRKDFKLIASKFIKQFLSKSNSKNKKLILFCRGSSGLLTASIFAEEILYEKVVNQVRIIDFKKDQESAHGNSCRASLFDKDEVKNSIFIIIDDFIASGDTINAILKEYREKYESYKTINNYSVETIPMIDYLVVSGSTYYEFQEIKTIFCQ